MKSSSAMERTPKHRICIVSGDNLHARLLQTCLMSAFAGTNIVCTDADLGSIISRTPNYPYVVILDCRNCDYSEIAQKLGTGDKTIPHSIKIALYNISDDRGLGLAPLVQRFNVRGVFYRKDSQETFIRGLEAILSGQLWLTRKILSRCALQAQSPSNSLPDWTNAPLSERETEILRHVVSGKRNQEIADLMGIQLNTVKTHLYNIYKKTNISNRLQGVLWAKIHLNRRMQESAQ